MTTALTTTTPRETKRHALRKWIQRIALILLVLGPVLFVVAALGYKFGLWDLGFAFSTLTRKIGPLILIGSMVFGLVGLLSGFAIKPRKGIIVSALAILIPAAGLFHAKSVGDTAAKLPLIHDITTDTQDPPTFSEAIMTERAKMDGVNTVDYVGKIDLREKELVSVLQVRDYPDIRPLVLSDTPDVVFGRAKAAVKSQGWKLVSEDAAAGRIEATDTTFWYGFKDDVVIRIRPSEGGGTVLDVRSISRIGQSDLGVNAERVRAFIKDVQG